MATSNPESEQERIINHCSVNGVTGEELKRLLIACDSRLEILNNQPQTADNSCLINDAIYGPVPLTSLMYQIINTPEFHRLKDIKQLGATNYVYPGANHTRFDHSIGVCYLAGVFGRHLQKQLIVDYPVVKFTSEEVLCAEIAGLCHDLGHGPFSHMFEDEVLNNINNSLKRTDLSVRIFKRLIVKHPKVLAEFIHAKLTTEHVKLIEMMIKPTDDVPDDVKKRHFLFEIVNNRTTGVDVNKWDYYARDCHYLGVTSDFQWKRCMHLGRILKTENDELHIGFRDKQLDDIYAMFRTRVILHQRAHQHKTIKAIEKMISDAIIEVHTFLKIPIHGRDPLTIQKIIQKTASPGCKLDDLDGYLALTDSIVGTIKCATLPYESPGPHKKSLQKAKILLERIEERDLYRHVCKLRIPKIYNSLSEDDQDSPLLLRRNALWQTVQGMERQVNGAEIHEQLEEEFKKEIQISNLWVKIVEFKLQPEDREDNPAERVIFYRKRQKTDEPLKPMTKQEVKEMSSMLVVPQAFVECELRVYDIRPAIERRGQDEKHKEALQNAMQKWKEDVEKRVQTQLKIRDAETQTEEEDK